MNAIITYVDRKLPFGNSFPLVRKRITKTSTGNFKDKQEFIDYISSIKPSRRVDTYLILRCNCGKTHEFKNRDEVPSLNMVCECKRELIMYGN